MCRKGQREVNGECKQNECKGGKMIKGKCSCADGSKYNKGECKKWWI